MLRLLLLISFLFMSDMAQAEANISSSEVYGLTLLIDKETELVRQQLNGNQKTNLPTNLNADIKPRHVWQKFYMLQIKLVAFSRKYNLLGISPVGLEPTEHFDPALNWAQAQRILTEIRIIKKMLGINANINNKLDIIDYKKPIDVFNKLAEIENKWDELTGADLDDAYTFDQVLRVNEDVNMILRTLQIFDNAIPPAKIPNSTPADALEQAFLLLEQIQRLQRLAGMETIDLTNLKKQNQVKPSDVFNLICLILAELQQIKARVGLNHFITLPATFHEHKTPADTRQFIAYVTNKLALIQHL